MKKAETAPVPSKNFPIALEECVICKPIPETELTTDEQLMKKIYLPPGQKEETVREAWVMALAPDIKGAFKIGDRVCVNSAHSLYVVHEGETYWLMHELEVLGKEVVGEDGKAMLQPFNKMVLVTRDKQDLELKSGIVLADVGQAMTCWGTVAGLGENVNKSIQVGHRVVYHSYRDYSFRFRNQFLYKMYEVDVKAIIGKKDFAGTTDPGRERRPDIPLDKLPEREKKVMTGKQYHYDKGKGKGK